ncbi:MAG: hypothetical protein Q8R38_00515 [Candidatus Omnitrophota bacterium]|nr:hypothetical protein [Candidatus Omnitrophota bacterium]
MDRKNKGFTIAEMQIALFVATIILIAAISLYIFYWRGFVTGNTVLDIYSNSRMAMGWIAKDVRSAAEILPQSTIVSGRTTSDSCIVLQVPSIANTGGSASVIPSQFDEIVYIVQDGNLQRIVTPYTAGLTPSVRPPENRAVARYCNLVTFYKVDTSTGTWTPLSGFLGSGGNLSTINNMGVSLPINETTLSLSGVETQNYSITPTMVLRLRNK